VLYLLVGKQILVFAKISRYVFLTEESLKDFFFFKSCLAFPIAIK
jgi:hypothetical protein